MKLPDQTPPVQRRMDQADSRHSTAGPAHTMTTSSLDQSNGIRAAGYEQCYDLQGMARQMCMLGFE
jgi:hypothetical protein